MKGGEEKERKKKNNPRRPTKKTQLRNRGISIGNNYPGAARRYPSFGKPVFIHPFVGLTGPAINTNKSLGPVWPAAATGRTY